jgi:hypothetical protein
LLFANCFALSAFFSEMNHIHFLDPPRLKGSSYENKGENYQPPNGDRTVEAPFLFASFVGPGRTPGRLPTTPVKQIRQSHSDSPSGECWFSKSGKPQIFDHPITGFPWLRLSGFSRAAAGPKHNRRTSPKARCADVVIMPPISRECKREKVQSKSCGYQWW